VKSAAAARSIGAIPSSRYNNTRLLDRKAGGNFIHAELISILISFARRINIGGGP
jgi:hypothetical protein